MELKFETEKVIKMELKFETEEELFSFIGVNLNPDITREYLNKTLTKNDLKELFDIVFKLGYYWNY